MRIFVAGASGVLGRALIPRLYRAGHTICAFGRHPVRPCLPESERFATCTLDILDAVAVREALDAFRPDVVINLATALPRELNPRRVGEQLGRTNLLREAGTRNLINGIPPSNRVRMIVPGFALAYAPGDGLADEDAPLYRQAPGGFAGATAALAAMEEQVMSRPGIDGVVLRLGALYGPDTGYDRHGAVASRIASRSFPVVADGAGTWSFLHVEDAATAMMHAITVEPGVYNVVDDHPANVSEWLPALARHLDAPAPRTVPAWLAKWIVGEFGLHMMRTLRGVSNKRFRATGWQPRTRPW